jgi:hypothetical protein
MIQGMQVSKVPLSALGMRIFFKAGTTKSFDNLQKTVPLIQIFNAPKYLGLYNYINPFIKENEKNFSYHITGNCNNF